MVRLLLITLAWVSLVTVHGGPAQRPPPQSELEELVNVPDEEIRQVSDQIWKIAKNGNNAVRGRDYQVNTGGPRLYPVFDEMLFNRPTYGALKNLITKYNPTIGEDDNNPDLPAAKRAFLDAVISTPEIQRVKQFLAEKGLAAGDDARFKDELNTWWMQSYSRSNGDAMDSSGFEHVFSGEIRDSGVTRDVTGYHNWIKHYLDEKAGTMVYGRRIDDCPTSPFEVLTYSFTWRDADKPIGGTFVGSSPEVELALKTLCFRAKIGRNCQVRIGVEDVNIVTFNYDNAVDQPAIGTAYPKCN